MVLIVSSLLIDGNSHPSITGMVKYATSHPGLMGLRTGYQTRVLTPPRKRTLHTMARGYIQGEKKWTVRRLRCDYSRNVTPIQQCWEVEPLLKEWWGHKDSVVTNRVKLWVSTGGIWFLYMATIPPPTREHDLLLFGGCSKRDRLSFRDREHVRTMSLSFLASGATRHKYLVYKSPCTCAHLHTSAHAHCYNSTIRLDMGSV